MAPPAPLTVKTAAQWRDDWLRVVANGLKARGVANPAVGPGTDYYIRAQALGDELEVLSAGDVSFADDMMPDTAEGESLRRWLKIIGSDFRSAGPSRGNGTFESTAASLVATNQELLDPTGNRIRVVTGGTYSNGERIALESVSKGSATQLPAGTVLRWVSPPAFSGPTMTLDAGGLVDGVDDEDNETARTRLLTHLATPPAGGNWSAVVETAEKSDVGIQKAFAYPAANGPSTMHTALVGYATAASSRTRVVSDIAKSNATSAITGAYPEFAEHVVTKSLDQQASVSFILTLPEAVTANPAGGGGGWVDGAPWPSINGMTQRFCAVTLVTSSTAFRVESAVAPATGETIAFISTVDFKLYTAKVLTSSTISGPTPPGTMGVYAITVDTPCTGIAVGDYVSPAQERGQAYLDALLDAFKALGPGEKTNVAGVLPRAYRRPREFTAWPYKLGNQFLKACTDAGAEVTDAAWGNQNGGVTSPTIPALITGSPSVFVPYRIGIYHL